MTFPSVSMRDENELPTRTRGFEKSAEIAVETRSSRNTLPWWLAEKFHWTEGATGRTRLSPLPEFLRAIEEDAPKVVIYGAGLLRPAGGSTEGGVVDALRSELVGVIQSLSALDDRESQALTRFLVDRATRNAVYAAITQFEIDNWVVKAASRGQDASSHDNFAQKETRRNNFSLLAAAFAELVDELAPGQKLSSAVYAKAARQIVYQQADMNTRETLSPKQEEERDHQAVRAAVLASRPI
jgi:hypothetical protein